MIKKPGTIFDPGPVQDDKNYGGLTMYGYPLNNKDPAGGGARDYWPALSLMDSTMNLQQGRFQEPIGQRATPSMGYQARGNPFGDIYGGMRDNISVNQGRQQSLYQEQRVNQFIQQLLANSKALSTAGNQYQSNYAQKEAADKASKMSIQAKKRSAFSSMFGLGGEIAGAFL
jgi:hypothetical protein